MKQRNYRTVILASILLFLIILLICFFLYFQLKKNKSSSRSTKVDPRTDEQVQRVREILWYSRATMDELQKIAADGDKAAQYQLGYRYDKGRGVPQDWGIAIEWYKKAAMQGSLLAQGSLASCYFNGKGVTKDLVLAYAWINIAEAQGLHATLWSDDLNRDSIVRWMTQSQIAEAQRLSSSWVKGTLLQREGVRRTAAKTPTTLLPATTSTTSIVDQSKRGTGTAFIVSKDGYVLTNHHVVEGCNEIRIKGKGTSLKVIADDKKNDLALLKIPDGNYPVAHIVEAPDKLMQGEDIVVFGYPLHSILASGGNITLGIISSLTGLGNKTNQIQITAPVQSGSSGSPVLNRYGEVVAMVSAKLDDIEMAKQSGTLPQNVNFAISGQTLKTFLKVHNVPFNTDTGFVAIKKETTELADEARKWTVVVECR